MSKDLDPVYSTTSSANNGAALPSDATALSTHGVVLGQLMSVFQGGASAGAALPVAPTSGSGNPWQQDQYQNAGSGAGRVQVFSKIAEAGDLTSDIVITWTGFTTPNRSALRVMPGTWDTNRVYSAQGNTTSGPITFTWTDPTRDCMVISAMAFTTSVAGVTVTYNDAANVSPEYTFASTQMWTDRRAYDAIDTSTSFVCNTGQANSTHATAVVVYQVAAPLAAAGPQPRPPGRVAPGGMGFIRTILGNTGLIPVQTAAPSGIASTNAFGNPGVNLVIRPPDAPAPFQRPPGKVSPAGVGFLRIALGSMAAVPRQTTATGIASTNAFGSPTVALKTTATGIASTNAFGSPTLYLQQTAEVHFPDPATTDFVWAALVTAATNLPTDTGDIQISLKQGSTVLNTSAWTALTQTPQVVRIVEVNYTGTDFRIAWKTRTTGALDALITNVELHTESARYFVNRARPPGRIAPNGVGFAPPPHPNREPQYPAVTGIAPNEIVGVPTARIIQLTAPEQTFLRHRQPPGKVSPGGAGFASQVKGFYSLQHVTPTGITPNEKVGIPVGSIASGAPIVHPTGIASTNAFGVPTVGSATPGQVHPTGIATANLIGKPTGSTKPSDALTGTVPFRFRPPGKLSPGGLGFIRQAAAITTSHQTIQAFGIPPQGTYTSNLSGAYTNQAGQPYTVEQFPAFGRPTVTLQLRLHPTGIASTNAFGSPTVKSRYTVRPSGIASTNAFGHPVVTPTGQTVVRPVGIASTNRFGVLGGQGTQSGPTGIASTNAFGSPTLTIAAQWNVKEPFSRWEIGYPRGRWVSRDPATAS